LSPDRSEVKIIHILNKFDVEKHFLPCAADYREFHDSRSERGGVMTLSELEASLGRLGIALSVKDGKLRCEAPAGRMTPGIKAALTTHKLALLATLGEAPSAPWPPRPAELAGWPVEWRARWGRRANELQDEGIPWPEHERRAFVEIQAEMTRMESMT
jgi:hypothetical protein